MNICELEAHSFFDNYHYSTKIREIEAHSFLKINAFRRKIVKLRRTPFLKMTGCVPSYCTCASREPQWRGPLGRTDPPRYSYVDLIYKTEPLNVQNFLWVEMIHRFSRTSAKQHLAATLSLPLRGKRKRPCGTAAEKTIIY